jgi:hypothetical protein
MQKVARQTSHSMLSVLMWLTCLQPGVKQKVMTSARCVTKWLMAMVCTLSHWAGYRSTSRSSITISLAQCGHLRGKRLASPRALLMYCMMQSLQNL